MMIERTETSSPDETEALARRLAAELSGGELLILRGDLGAGKTVFVRGLAAGLDCADEVASPTFVLERVYRGRLILVHADLYRAASARDLAFEEALAAGQVVAVEWGERLPESARRGAIEIAIRAENPGEARVIEIRRP